MKASWSRVQTTAKKPFVIVTGAVLLLLAAWFFPYQRSMFTCLYCRAGKQVSSYAHMEFIEDSETPCSTWYAQTFPPHRHQWVKSSCTRVKSGFSMGVSCRLAPTIWLLPADRQKEFLARAGAEERDEFFRRMQSGEREEILAAVHHVERR